MHVDLQIYISLSLLVKFFVSFHFFTLDGWGRLPYPGCTLSTGICASISQYLCPRSWSGSLKFTAYEFLNGSLFMIVWWTSYIFISLSRDVELCFTITQSITVKIMFFVGMQLEFKFRLKMWLVWSRLLRLEFYPHTAITHSMYHNLYKILSN